MSSKKRQKQLFGTNGVRGIVGEDMTPDLVMRIGMSLASMRRGRIAVGRDTRTSGPALVSAIKAGILACGCDVVDLGVLPTPAVQYLVKHHFDAGVVITASHNPPEYNGVKIIEPDGTEMGDEEIITLEERLFKQEFKLEPWQTVGTDTTNEQLVTQYIDAVVNAFPQGIGEGMKVVVDPGSGPASFSTPAILSAMGCKVHTVNAQEDGTFPGRLPEPTPEGLQSMAVLVTEIGAAFGVAHDGDADRAVFIDEKGNYVEENAEFALMQRFICQNRKGAVVTPVSTSQQVEKIAADTECQVVYTPVGSIYVARKMLKMKEQGVEVLFGGEGNGGLIFPDHQYCRDGGMTAASMVALLAAGNKSLSALVGELPERHMIKEKIRSTEPGAIITLVSNAFPKDQLDFTDGIRINRTRSWALLRPSGTEPFMRLLVEAEHIEEARSFYREIMDVIR
jgi:phosphomannomutase/phosphoglucomutase